MKLTRRDFIKSNAIAATATAAGITIPGVTQALATSKDVIRWDKAPCRFCGTGCSVLVGTREGRVVATQGDPDVVADLFQFQPLLDDLGVILGHANGVFVAKEVGGVEHIDMQCM